MLRRYLFRRTPRGTIDVSLTADEAALLGQLRDELVSVLEADPRRSLPGDDTGEFGETPGETDDVDAVLARLFPAAYSDPTEGEAESEWQRLMHDELVRSRLAALDAVAADLAGATRRRGRVELELDGEQVAGWLGALNDARLALGTRLAVTEDLDYDLEGRDPADPHTQAYAVYMWLGWAQEMLLEALNM